MKLEMSSHIFWKKGLKTSSFTSTKMCRSKPLGGCFAPEIPRSLPGSSHIGDTVKSKHYMVLWIDISGAKAVVNRKKSQGHLLSLLTELLLQQLPHSFVHFWSGLGRFAQERGAFLGNAKVFITINFEQPPVIPPYGKKDNYIKSKKANVSQVIHWTGYIKLFQVSSMIPAGQKNKQKSPHYCCVGLLLVGNTSSRWLAERKTCYGAPKIPPIRL